MTSPSLRSPWLLAFAVVSLVHLALNAADATPWDSVTKCLVAPLLIGWVVAQHGPRLLVLALVFCFGGDLFLEIEDLFIVGMASFAAGHVCFIRFFVARGALAQLRRKPWILAVYGVAGVALIAYAWGGLEDGLKVPVPFYALLLLGTGATSLATDRLAGLGGAMFLVSDGIIALSEADRFDKDATATGLAIMTLYILAILFLAVGIVRKEQTSRNAGDGFDPTIRTDCWPRLPQQPATKA